MWRFPTLFLLHFAIVSACWCQVANRRSAVTVDLSWVALDQEESGWRVTAAPAYSNSQRTLQRGDLIMSIDGQNVAVLGPLAITAMLVDVPFRAVPMTIERSGESLHLKVFGEGVTTDGTTKGAPSYSSDKLQKRGEQAAQFSLPDLRGRLHTLDMYRGKWLLLNIWGTWCTGCRDEIPALNYLAALYGDRLTVVGVAMNDTPDILDSFVQKRRLSYAVLVGGDFDSAFSRTYSLHLAPTNIVISPAGQVRFVGVGPMSLKRAVQTIADGES